MSPASRPYLPVERIVPAVVDISAERSAPGRVLQRMYGNILVSGGRRRGGLRRSASRTRRSRSGPRGISPPRLCRKLTVNCAGGVCGIVDKPNGISRDPAIAELMLALAEECVAVGRRGRRAAGRRSRRLGGPRLPGRAAPESINSLHADRMAGRPMEIDARHGVIVRLGDEARHYATPMNGRRPLWRARFHSPSPGPVLPAGRSRSRATRFAFTIAATDGKARTGTIAMQRGEIRTPAFMPVGTAATVKAMKPADVARDRRRHHPRQHLSPDAAAGRRAGGAAGRAAPVHAAGSARS